MVIRPARLWLNELLVGLPIGLVYPFRRFRALHLRHHADESLTDPFDDPESYYRAFWQHEDLPALAEGAAARQQHDGRPLRARPAARHAGLPAGRIQAACRRRPGDPQGLASPRRRALRSCCR